MIILVDCFDTVIHRYKHPYQILRRWAKSVHRLYPSISTEELYKDRFDFIKTEQKIDEYGIYAIYEKLANRYISLEKIDKEVKKEFIDDLRLLEIECESSVHYVNNELINWLKEQKNCSIYCVTDYHFSSCDMKRIFENAGIADVFLDVFSSADYRKTKHTGNLYEVVIDTLGVNPKECLMIGDNKISDIENAKKMGMDTWYRSNGVHKMKLSIYNRINVRGGEKHPLKTLANRFWKESNSYEEFVLIIYVFCERLYKAVNFQNGKKICFLAREGYFLKECFELYQTLCIPREERIEAEYLRCSRRAIHSVQKEKCKPEFFEDISLRNYFRSIGFCDEDIDKFPIEEDLDSIIYDFSSSLQVNEIVKKNHQMKELIENRFLENESAFKQYVNHMMDGEVLYLVDVGWIGRMQQGIQILFPNIVTRGYYLGIYDNLIQEPFDIERKGLIFNKDVKGRKTKYFDIFRSNTQIYEQLLAAPHGSASHYRFDEDGNVKVMEVWEENEKELYHERIFDVQSRMKKMFRKVCCLDYGLESEDTKLNLLAKMHLKSSLIQTEDRLNFMKCLNAGFSQNFQQQESGLKFEVSKLRIRPLEMLLHPERYVRYFAKVGVFLEKKGLVKLRFPICGLFYVYTRIVNRL